MPNLENTAVKSSPLLITRGLVMFPGPIASIDVGRLFSLAAMNKALDLFDGDIVVVTQKDIAINEFLNAYQLKDDDVNLVTTLAMLLEESGDKNHAMEFYEKHLEHYPDSIHTVSEYVDLLIDNEMYEKAEELIEKYSSYGEIASFLNSKARIFYRKKEYDSAINSLDKLIESDKNNAESYYFKGLILNKKEEYKKALSLITTALELNPQPAKYYFQEGKYDIAIEFLLDIVQSIKDDETLNMLAICYLEQKQYENAMGIFYKLANKYPNNHILLTNLAKCEIKCSKISEAQEHLRQALMVFDDYKEALDLLEEINCGK